VPVRVVGKAPSSVVEEGLWRSPVSAAGLSVGLHTCTGDQAALETEPDADPASACDVCSLLRAERRAADTAGARLCRLAVSWAVMHPADRIHQPATYIDRGRNRTDLNVAGAGAPSIAEYAVAEFATAVGMSEGAGRDHLGHCVGLRYRLPGLWAGSSPATRRPGRPASSPERRSA
jgi:hypothetical protein